MECKKCPYYESRREIAAGKVLVGFCKLRGKHMTDTTKSKELCKDRATFDIPANAKPVVIKPEPSLYTPKEKEQVEKAMQKPVERAPASPTFAEMAAKQAPQRASIQSDNAFRQESRQPVRTMMLPLKAGINQSNNPQKPSNPNPCAHPNPAMKTPIPSYDAGSKKASESVRTMIPSPRAVIKQTSRQQENRRVQPKQPAASAAIPSAEKPKMPAQIVPPMKLSPEDAIRLLEQQLSGKINATFRKGGNEARSDAEKEIIRRAVWGGGT